MASSHRDEISRLELLQAAHPDGLVFPHLADAYRRAGRYAQAESVLNAGLRRHSDYSSAHLVLGRLRLDQGKRQEAQDAFQKVLQLDPHNQVALETLARLADEAGRTEEALGYYRRLLNLKDNNTIADRIQRLEEERDGAPVRDGAGAPRDEPGYGRHGWSPQPSRAAPGTGPRRAEAGVEPGEVVTETMAELYARQGLHERAAVVYRKLLESRPGDARLLARLRQVERGMDPTPPERTPPPVPSIGRQLRAMIDWRPAPAAAPWRPTPAEAPTASPAPSQRQQPGDHQQARQQPRPEMQRDTQPSARPAGPPRPLRSQRRRHAARIGPATVTADEAASALGTEAFRDLAPQARSLIALTDLLVGLLEYRDPFFRGSSSLTRLLAISVAEELGLSEEEQVDLAMAAVLRDLGRLALGGRLIQVPARGAPTLEARRKIERHVDLAIHLLEGIDLPPSVRLAVRHHHERWDGAGYPDALAGESIPRLARILSVVDSFAAMVSPRPYRLPRKVPEAAAELQEEAGTRYDPEMVNALVRVLARRDQPHLGFVQRHHILIVNQDQPGALVTAAKLCSAGYLAEVSGDPATARERLRRVPVAALVVSAEMGGDRAARFTRDLRADAMFADLPIVVTEAADVALRVRLLESGADVCFPSGISHAELQGTLGALVRRSSRSDGLTDAQRDAADAPWLALHGDIQDFPLTWLLQVMKYDSRTAAIGIRSPAREGVIFLRGGDAVHAAIRGGARGEAALREMLRWRRGRFTVQPDARPRQQTITTSIMHLLLTQAVDQDHAAAGIFGAVEPDS